MACDHLQFAGQLGFDIQPHGGFEVVVLQPSQRLQAVYRYGKNQFLVPAALAAKDSAGTRREQVGNRFQWPAANDALLELRPVSAGFDAYKRVHRKETDVGYGYDEHVNGGDLRLGKEISEYVKEDLTYRCDSIRIANIDDSASNDLKKEGGVLKNSQHPSLFFPILFHMN